MKIKQMSVCEIYSKVSGFIWNKIKYPYYKTAFHEIGKDVRISRKAMIKYAKTAIIPANHRFDHIDIPQYKQSLTKKGMKIEDDVWIGTNVTILDGVTIHRGCVVGGCSCNKRYSRIFCCYGCTCESY